MSGKGSKPRPIIVPYETYSSNWDSIFKKNQEKCDGCDTPSDTRCESVTGTCPYQNKKETN